MTVDAGDVLGGALSITLVVIVASMVMTFYRLAKGPTLADRVVALDLLGILMVAFAAVYAIATKEAAFLDVAIGFALVAFLSTVALARYGERRAHARGEVNGFADATGRHQDAARRDTAND